MTVYGIYVSDFGSTSLQTPLYYKEEEAIKEAEKIVNESQSKVDKMKEFTKDDREFIDMYRDFKKDEKTIKNVEGIIVLWVGGAYDHESVSVEKINVI